MVLFRARSTARAARMRALEARGRSKHASAPYPRSLAYADEAIRIRRLAPLTERDIARATGAGVSTVSAWLHRTRAPSGRRAERLVELSAIIERLATVLDQEYVPVWLNRPLVALDHRKPIDVLASGGYEELSRIVAGLEAPTFS